ncbi:MAG: hypothetical protein ACC662_11545, partial [Planctomycetota bacterium]
LPLDSPTYQSVKRILEKEPKVYVPKEKLDDVRQAILREYAQDDCLVEVGNILYRSREDRYRVDITVDDGCQERAKEMCREISELVEDLAGCESEVWAYTSGNALMARWLP